MGLRGGFGLGLGLCMGPLAQAESRTPPPPLSPGLATPSHPADPASSHAARHSGGARGEPLSLNFQAIDVRAALQVIADFTGLNLVVSDAVSGELTLRLHAVPWEQALDVILRARDLGMRREGSVLWIAPRADMQARDKAELDAAAAQHEQGALATEAFALHYAKASDIALQLGSGSGGADSPRLLSRRGSVVAEPRTNQIFVTDVARKLRDVEALLARLDVPVRQVLIEARIVEANETFGRSLGVRLGGALLAGGQGGRGLALGGDYSQVRQLAGGQGGAGDGAAFVNLPAASATGASVAAFALSIFGSGAQRLLTLELSALEAEGQGRVVSSPRVVTADQSKALIEQGTEIPYQHATSNGATAVSFRKAHLKLEVTPQITPEGHIIMELSVNKDSIGQRTDSGLAINTKHVRTQVLVEDGGTVMIGGIYEMLERQDASRVPLLADLPLVGGLFRNSVRSTSKQEVLVFVTPQVIAQPRARAAASRIPPDETRHRGTLE